MQPLICASPGSEFPAAACPRAVHSAHTHVAVAAPSGTVRVRDPLGYRGNTPQAMSSAAREAHRFSIAVMQLVVEVIGRHRGTSRLGEAVNPAIADQIAVLVRHDAFRIAKTVAASANRTHGTSTGPAVQRLHVQLCDPCNAEVFGSFTTGGRVRPFAARVERKPRRIRPGAFSGGRPALGRVEYRWQLVTLEFC
ncbi:Rv3235 family protein [Gordonia sp. NPDC058843]|uniref:Rv3235 family protein n=1 Tax=Gordonia sp. NPDC058843 TaxID=3346648 RepID=UPI003675334B